jgi:hypothetical protein
MTTATKKPTLATPATIKRAKLTKVQANKRKATPAKGKATINAKTKAVVKTPKTFTASELAKAHGMQSKTLRARIRRNAEFFADKYASAERKAGEQVVFLTKHRAAIDTFLAA